jgi:hypothetical protein
MIYTAPCIMFWMRAYPLRGEVGGGWALEFSSFLGPVKWHEADRRLSFHRRQPKIVKTVSAHSKSTVLIFRTLNNHLATLSFLSEIIFPTLESESLFP